jgi:hypothetical protein
MAKTQRDKFDLFTLAIKQQLIGTELVMEDDTVLEVKDFYMDYATAEIHIDFVGGAEASFNLHEKFIVNIEDTYKSVSSKKKNKKNKKK